MSVLRKLKMSALNIKNANGRFKIMKPIYDKTGFIKGPIGYESGLKQYKVISEIAKKKRGRKKKRSRRFLKNKHICRMMHVQRNPVRILWRERFRAMGPVPKINLNNKMTPVSIGHERRFMPRPRA